jgi:glycosyltransferase involved in cell wall biosynthesis
MVRAWLALGAESVLWVNPYPTRLPCFADLFRERGMHEQGTALDPRVEVLNVPALPIEPLPGGSVLNRRWLWQKVWRRIEEFAGLGETVLGIGKPSALALSALREIDFAGSFFDAMDNFPEFHRGLSRRSMQYYENAVAEEADAVLASSTFLADKFERRWLRVEKVLNGYPMSTLPPWRPRPESHQPRPVLGYVGCLGPWLDWPLVVSLAEQLPETNVELIGPCPCRPPRKLPKNIKLLPACPQTEAVKHLSRFSAGLIPFKSNPLTAGVDPIKYYEYRAAGLPVLSTRFGEMTRRGEEEGVYFIDQTDDLPDAAERALQHDFTEKEIRRFRRENDWDDRFIRREPFNVFWNEQKVRHAA